MDTYTKPTLVLVLLVSLVALTSVGLVSSQDAGQVPMIETQGSTVELTHDETVEPDGEFEIIVDTTDSAGTVLEIDPDGFDVDLSSEDAVVVDENRVEFLDASAESSTYEITVDVQEGSDDDTADIVAWVNAEDRDDADDEATTTITLDSDDGSPETGTIESLEYPDTVETDGEFEVSVETTNTAGTIVEFDPDGFDVDLSSEDAVVVDENRVEFLDASAESSTYEITVDVQGGSDDDTADIVAWVNAEDRDDADDEASTTITLDSDDESPETGTIESLEHPDTVEPDEEFEIDVETTNTAGTIVEFDPDGFDVALSSEDSVAIDDNTVEFLDASAGDSSYSITVDVQGGNDDDIGDITAWVNAEDRDNADDEATSIVTIEEDDGDSTGGGGGGALEPAIVEVSFRELPSDVEPGDSVDIDVTATNIGDATAEQEITLSADDDVVDSVDQRIPSNNQRFITFSFEVDDDHSDELPLTVESEDDEASTLLQLADTGADDETGDTPEEDDDTSDDDDTVQEEDDDSQSDDSDADDSDASDGDTPDDDDADDDTVPGFGPLVALVGLILAGLISRMQQS